MRRKTLHSKSLARAFLTDLCLVVLKRRKRTRMMMEMGLIQVAALVLTPINVFGAC